VIAGVVRRGVGGLVDFRSGQKSRSVGKGSFRGTKEARRFVGLAHLKALSLAETFLLLRVHEPDEYSTSRPPALENGATACHGGVVQARGDERTARFKPGCGVAR